jgi:dephospho-CoA kinase
LKTPFLIGLTGGIGVGKSSVAFLLERRGAQVVSGDELGRQALEESPQLLASVRERFGDDVFGSDGSLLRRKLGERVFASPKHVRWLTAQTFPRIYQLWREAIQHATAEVVVFDAALIIEWGIERDFDCLIVVTASPEIVRRRLRENGRLSDDELRARQTGQTDPAVRLAVADVVFTNDGSPESLEAQVNGFWSEQIVPRIQRRKEQHDG